MNARLINDWFKDVKVDETRPWDGISIPQRYKNALAEMADAGDDIPYLHFFEEDIISENSRRLALRYWTEHFAAVTDAEPVALEPISLSDGEEIPVVVRGFSDDERFELGSIMKEFSRWMELLKEEYTRSETSTHFEEIVKHYVGPESAEQVNEGFKHLADVKHFSFWNIEPGALGRDDSIASSQSKSGLGLLVDPEAAADNVVILINKKAGFFDAERTSMHNVGVIIHEMTHYMLDTKDHAYRPTDCVNLARGEYTSLNGADAVEDMSPQDLALNNADTYRLIAEATVRYIDRSRL